MLLWRRLPNLRLVVNPPITDRRSASDRIVGSRLALSPARLRTGTRFVASADDAVALGQIFKKPPFWMTPDN